jgi:hypothetical protein
LEDFDQLRQDVGMAGMLGHGIPSPEAARDTGKIPHLTGCQIRGPAAKILVFP